MKKKNIIPADLDIGITKCDTIKRIKKSQVREPEYFIQQTAEESAEFKRKLMKEHEPQSKRFHEFLKTLPKYYPKLHKRRKQDKND